jgi:hypothetical protein
MNSDSTPLPTKQLFSVSPLKFIVMSATTFGLYKIYWMYRNWKAIKANTGENIEPLWRGIFGYFFCYSLFKWIKTEADSHSLKASFSAGLTALLFIALSLSGRLPAPFFFLALISFVPLLPVRSAIDNLNFWLNPDFERNSKFSIWNIIFALLGSVIWILALVGTIFPEFAEQGAAANP